MRRRGARSFVDDLVLSRGVVLSRADLFCDLLRLSPMTRRFVRFRRTYLRKTFHCFGRPRMPYGQRTLSIFRLSTRMPYGQRTLSIFQLSTRMPYGQLGFSVFLS